MPTEWRIESTTPIPENGMLPHQRGGLALRHVFDRHDFLWRRAWPSRLLAGWMVRALGVLTGAGVLVWQLSGASNFQARQGALVVSLGHALWTIMAASLLLGRKRNV